MNTRPWLLILSGADLDAGQINMEGGASLRLAVDA